MLSLHFAWVLALHVDSCCVIHLQVLLGLLGLLGVMEMEMLPAVEICDAEGICDVELLFFIFLLKTCIALM